MIRKFFIWLKTFGCGEEETANEGFINIVTPELETKVKFNGRKDLNCSIKRTNGRIEIKFGKTEDYCDEQDF